MARLEDPLARLPPPPLTPPCACAETENWVGHRDGREGEKDSQYFFFPGDIDKGVIFRGPLNNQTLRSLHRPRRTDVTFPYLQKRREEMRTEMATLTE